MNRRLSSSSRWWGRRHDRTNPRAQGIAQGRAEERERNNERAVADLMLAFGWQKCHDALLSFIQQRPELFTELLKADLPPSPSPERGKQMAEALREQGRAEMREEAAQVANRNYERDP